MSKSRPIYATTRRRFSGAVLLRMGFRQEGCAWVKRGACRAVLATAYGSNDSYRITPDVRHWR